MSNLDLARFQFAMTSIYHFLFVPLTIGLSFLVAILQTRWHRSGDPELKRLTKFFGKILLVNVAIGVVTGLVQEFQFGMNWSSYSRFVGDVFGAPLAMEGLLAFFLESTFLGLWIFGWDRLPKGVHLACIWLVSLGTAVSATFIIAANSWMQNPVGYTVNPDTGRAELTDIGAVFTNPIFIHSILHTILAALVTGSLLMLGVAAWHIRKKQNVATFMHAARLSIVVLLPSILLTMMVGSELGVQEATYQPMKIAAAESQWTTCTGCSFSAFQIGGGNNDQNPTKVIQIPNLLSVLATGSPDGTVQGLNELQAEYEQKYGPGYYIPDVFVQYWSMRVMAYLATLILLFAIWGAFLMWRRKIPKARWFLGAAVVAAFTPYVMNSAGWMLAENGRQPWIVQGLMLTEDGLSMSVPAWQVLTSIVVFAAIYLVLGIIWGVLMWKSATGELPPAEEETPGGTSDTERVPTLTY